SLFPFNQFQTLYGKRELSGERPEELDVLQGVHGRSTLTRTDGEQANGAAFSEHREDQGDSHVPQDVRRFLRHRAVVQLSISGPYSSFSLSVTPGRLVNHMAQAGGIRFVRSHRPLGIRACLPNL